MHKQPLSKRLMFFCSRRPGLLLAAAALGLFAGVMALAAMPGHAPPPAVKAAVPALNVTQAFARVETWPTSVVVPGGIAPWQEAVIGAQVGGLRLLELQAEVGDSVRQGQVVARFDTEMLQAEEAQLKAALTQAEAAAAQAETNRQRALTLKDIGGMSEQDILLNHTQAVTTKAQMEAVKAQLAAKRLQLRYALVVAPDDGVISARSAVLGAVSASGQELFRLIRKNRLEWRGELTAAQLAQIEIGQTIELELPDGGQAQAMVRQIAPALDGLSRLGMLYADIQAGSRARAGMYANGRILLSRSPALTVPAASVIIRDGRSYVLKLREQQELFAVKLQAVSTGRRQGQAVEILQGLAENEQVAVQGAGFLNDGDLVRVVAAGSQTGEASNP